MGSNREQNVFVAGDILLNAETGKKCIVSYKLKRHIVVDYADGSFEALHDSDGNILPKFEWCNQDVNPSKEINFRKENLFLKCDHYFVCTNGVLASPLFYASPVIIQGGTIKYKASTAFNIRNNWKDVTKEIKSIFG